MPEFTERRKKNSTKANLTFSLVFHGILIGAAALWAAHEGILGKQAKEITAFIVPKAKPKEPEKAPPPKAEPPKEVKQDAKPPPTVAPVQQVASTAPPPATDVNVAPPATETADVSFSDGAQQVVTSAAEAASYRYKAVMESSFQGNWKKPDDVDDAKFVAEVQVTIDPHGEVKGSQFLHGSGNAAWDDSVKKAVAETKSVILQPPANFPSTVVIRFDTQQDTAPVLQ